MFNDDFYPTPEPIIRRMWKKIKGDNGTILEPSAGKGDIADFIKSTGYVKNIYCIEKDPSLRSILIGKGHSVIDSDFLLYSGTDRFDAVVMNPPFSEGDKHLLKAIEILYSGEIVCLLNAETLRNAYTNTRKLLAQKLGELGASVEYVCDAFKNAERKTDVEIAIIHIDIKRDTSKQFFEFDNASETTSEIDEEKRINERNTIDGLISEYRLAHDAFIEIARTYYKNKQYIGDAFDIKLSNPGKHDDVNSVINNGLADIRKKYWNKALSLDAVEKRLTMKKRDEFYSMIDANSKMDFTESNIKELILGLIDGYEETLADAVEEIFDLMTIRHFYSESECKNIHYFNGWKTNKSFYVNKKIILPISNYSYSNTIVCQYTGKLGIGYASAQMLDDIDIVMNYFNGSATYTKISNELKEEFKYGSTKGESEFFTFVAYKKGTIHLTFKSDDILRRFNVVACKKKKWLPGSYGETPYAEMTAEEKSVVDSFEGERSYTRNIRSKMFEEKKDTKMIEE